MRLTQGIVRGAAFNGRETAIVSAAGRWTWGEFSRRIGQTAGALRSLGFRPGDRAAILALNSHRYLEALFAIPWAGGIAVPINHRLNPAEIEDLLHDCEPSLLLIDDAFLALLPGLRDRVRSIQQVILIGDSHPTGMGIGYERLIAGVGPIEDAGRSADDTACIFYTGGTTGPPKGVMLTHGNLYANAINFIAHTGLDETVVHLHCGPLFHVASAARIYMVSLLGGTHVVLPRFSAPEVLATIQEHQVTMATFVPTMLQRIVDELDADPWDLPSLEWITYGAAPMPEVLLRRVMERFPKVKLAQSYGMTELSPVATMLGHRYHCTSGPLAGKLRSAGRPVLTADVAVVGPDGMRLGQGKTGEVVVRGPMVMKGYWRQPEQTAAVLKDGWMHTGDVGYFDVDGFLFVVDRLKDVIISGGENIYSIEVENAICAHPAVAECAVIGIPDPAWGETVHAIVVPRLGQAPAVADIIAHCRTLIAGYKCPRSIEFRTEALPLSGANKILKSALRKPLTATS